MQPGFIKLPRTLIYGAGVAGRQLASILQKACSVNILGFLDDNQQLHRCVLDGYPVYLTRDLAKLFVLLEIQCVFLAVPSISLKRRQEIIDRLLGLGVTIHTVPPLSDLVDGKVRSLDLRELDVDELLGRVPVEPNYDLMARSIADQGVLVTGAAGSIGSELCDQLLKFAPSALLLVDHSELALYTVHSQLRKKYPGLKIVPFLASVCDKTRMRAIVSAWRPSIIFHASAYKHVPMLEYNPMEGIKANLFGTWYLAVIAMEAGVSQFVFVSTDKAVRPRSVMGATKRLSEMVLQALSSETQSTKFSIVRFGNVLASSGSVVPKFFEQIRNRQPVTVTHPEMNRYFMKASEAAQLVIQAGAMAEGGDIFLLDMGTPINILDLARHMIARSGLRVKDENTPDGDIEIRIIGLRVAAEKLSEELLESGKATPTAHESIIRLQADALSWNILEAKLMALEVAVALEDVVAAFALLTELIPEYQPANGIWDYVWTKKRDAVGFSFDNTQNFAVNNE